jgi:putative ABC transport system ATP-binding protein
MLSVEGLRFARPGSGRFVLSVPRLELQRGSRTLLTGPSGCGKSTLLGLVAGTLSPSRGRIAIDGTDIAAMAPRLRDSIRADRMGVIFQEHALVPFLSMRENVLLATSFSPSRAARIATAPGGPVAEADRMLRALGLDPVATMTTKVVELSTGERQRVAVARALFGDPDLVLADEPTSALDAEARGAFLELLGMVCARRGATLLMVSHDVGLASWFDCTIPFRAISGNAPDQWSTA